MSILSITTLQQPGATGAEATSLVTASKSLVATHNWSFLLAQSLMPAFNALLLGSVLYRSRLVPRILPVVGLIGAPLLLASTIATMFGFVEQYSAVTGIVTIPICVGARAGPLAHLQGLRSVSPDHGRGCGRRGRHGGRVVDDDAATTNDRDQSGPGVIEVREHVPPRNARSKPQPGGHRTRLEVDRIVIDLAAAC